MWSNVIYKEKDNIWCSTMISARANSVFIYINDLPRLPSVTDYFNLRLFADDSNIIHTFPAHQDDINVDEVMNNTWKIVKIGIKGKLNIAGEEIQAVDVTTYDRNLPWNNSHIRYVNQCIRIATFCS